MSLLSSTVVAIIIGVILFVLLIKLLKKPLKWVWKLALNALSGYIGLFFLNLLGGAVGLHIDVTIWSALIVGILGLPGIIILLIYQYLL